MVAQAGHGVHLRPDLDRPMDEGVLQRDGGVRGEDAHEVELARLEAGVLAAAPDVEDAQHPFATAQRRQDQGRRVGAGASHAPGLAPGEHLGGHAARVGKAAREEGIGTLAAGQQGTEPSLVDLVDVDPERVDVDDAAEAVGQLGHDRGRVEVGEDGLGDAQQLPLAVQLLVECLLLGTEASGDVGVDHGLRGDRGVDAQVAQVVGREAVETQLGEDDDADGAILVDHGRHEHGLGEVGFRAGHLDGARVAGRVRQVLRDAGARHPAGDALAETDPQLVAVLVHVLARLAVPGDGHDVVATHPVDAHVVVVDELPKLGADGLADLVDGAQVVEPRAELGDRVDLRFPVGARGAAARPGSQPRDQPPDQGSQPPDQACCVSAARTKARRSSTRKRRSPRTLTRRQRSRPWSAQARSVLGWTPSIRAALVMGSVVVSGVLVMACIPGCFSAPRGGRL